MKNLLPLLATTAAALLVAGCQSVPATKISVNPQTGAVMLDSPKEIGIEELEATLPNGVTVRLKGYQSHNSSEVLGVVAASNAKTLEQAISILDKAKSGAGPLLIP